MPYPMNAPTNKHDMKLISSMPSPDVSLMSSDWAFSSTSALFRAVNDFAISKPPTPFASIYSYKDAPDFPGPLSRELVILGVADSKLNLVRKLAEQDVPDCLHRCTLAVKLADPKHMAKLPPNHQQNSKSFGRFMQRLQKEECVAIFAKDKHDRFGILQPMAASGGGDGRSLLPEDCAAHCFVGDVQDVVEFLSQAATAGNEDDDDVVDDDAEPTTPPYPPPPDGNHDDPPIFVPEDDNNYNTAAASSSSDGIWQPPGDDGGDEGGVWKPPGADDDGGGGFSAPWASGGGTDSVGDSAMPWGAPADPEPSPWMVQDSSNGGGSKRSYEDMNGGQGNGGDGGQSDDEDDENKFHSNQGAAAADEFYSNLKRNLGTRSDSWIYHMRAFNGWVKAMQIQELDPRLMKNGKPQGKTPLRILDLACGKGGDLLKWAKHKRGMEHYVGIDVARGSLKDAAIRARGMRLKNQLKQAIFTCADLGDDVPGRKKTKDHKQLQKLLTWSLLDEDPHESGTPDFKPLRGGGVAETDRFDVVSVQFAIHYMMSTGKRARRFFHTVSELLQVGGNLICTTIDARVVMKHLLNLGLNYHYDDDQDGEGQAFPNAEISVGSGSCLLRFEPEIVKRIFTAKADGSKGEEELFGLQYTFTLKDGNDNAGGVGEAVDLPEWLTPLPILESLAKEAGLELDYAQNFHEFWQQRKDPSTYVEAHGALQNMKVPNRKGSISDDEWSISRLYAAISFRKVRESKIQIDDAPDADDEESDDEEPKPVELDPIKAKKMLPMAILKAKKLAGEAKWATLSKPEKEKLFQVELEKIAAK